jgi:hypothetical protein
MLKLFSLTIDGAWRSSPPAVGAVTGCAESRRGAVSRVAERSVTEAIEHAGSQPLFGEIFVDALRPKSGKKYRGVRAPADW